MSNSDDGKPRFYNKPNYDYEFRYNIEEKLIGFALSFDKNNFVKDMFYKHCLTNEDFINDKVLKSIFKAILKCWEENKICELNTISHYFDFHLKKEIIYDRNSDINTRMIVAIQKAITTTTLEQDIMFLKQFILKDFWNKKAYDILDNHWSFRDVLVVSDNIINGYNDTFNIVTKNIKTEKSDSDFLEKAYENAKNGISNNCPTGIEAFDNFTGGGFINTELSIIAGRPAMGKTSVAIAIAVNMSLKFGKKGAFFTLEMPSRQLKNKIISSQTGIEYEKIKSLKNLTQEEFEKVKSWYKYFENDSNLKIYQNFKTIGDIRNEILTGNYDFAFIDYLQLMKMDRGVRTSLNNREQEIAYFSRTLKETAVEANIPIIPLSQLSRKLESRVSKRPMLSDLRESGAIEQDADNIYFPYRDAYYRKLNNQIVQSYEEGNLDFIIAKGRDTGTTDIKMNLDFKKLILSEGSAIS